MLASLLTGSFSPFVQCQQSGLNGFYIAPVIGTDVTLVHWTALTTEQITTQVSLSLPFDLSLLPISNL